MSTAKWTSLQGKVTPATTARYLNYACKDFAWMHLFYTC